VWRTLPTLSAVKLWRQDAQVALRRGTMRPPTAKTIIEAAGVLIAGAHDGTILNRAGKPYKPSTARGYEQLLHTYVIPTLGGWKLSELQRRDVQNRRRPAHPGPLPLDDRQQPRSAAGDLPSGDPPRRDRRRPDGEPRPARHPRPPHRIEPPQVAHELLAALRDSERAFWAVALFCGLRRGELRGLQ